MNDQIQPLAPVYPIPGPKANKPRPAPERDAQAKLLAVEVLLADPAYLENDALEADLYFLRDRLRLENADLGRM